MCSTLYAYQYLYVGDTAMCTCAHVFLCMRLCPCVSLCDGYRAVVNEAERFLIGDTKEVKNPASWRNMVAWGGVKVG